MSNRVYTVVIAGMGKRGMHHGTTFHANPRFKVAGICDIVPDKLASAAAKLGNPKTGTDAGALLRELKPDVFCFCTLPGIRYDFVQLGVEAGVKLIAYEKPMALTSAEAIKIMNLVRKTGVKTVVSHQHRYGAHYKKVKEIIDSGAIGRVHTVYAHSPGWMMHMMTHMIDYARWYSGNAEAQWVMAQAAGLKKMTDVHPSPDHIAGFIQFANGIQGIVQTGGGAPDVPEVAKWWHKNRIGAQGTEGFAEVLTGGGWRAVTKNGVLSGGGVMNYDQDMPPYIQDMADWLDDDKKVHCCNGEETFKGFEILCALMRSVVDRGQVALPLTDGRNELDELAKALPKKPLICVPSPDSYKEYGAG
jgi:predicted dehydrogenase